MEERQSWHEDPACVSSLRPMKKRKVIHSVRGHEIRESRDELLLSHDQYSIAWICALPIEMAAAQVMLDEVHKGLPSHANDTNTYTLGSVGDHNVVIVCLPADRYGANNAANVLTHLVRTFPLIRLGLIVGIGGGAPGKVDIRLGDIVVGTMVIQCDLGKIVGDGQIQHTAIPRYPPLTLSTDDPFIHYAGIASGNQVMRSSMHRDKISQQLGVVCFEMEAAGLMDILPCLPIRGVCDYADSHKNKEWQRYAAAVATAYARELLMVLPVSNALQRPFRPPFSWQDISACLRDLRETDPRDDKTRIERTKGGLLRECYCWILDNAEFARWHDNPQSQLLWIKGDPGKGKTMLLCGIIDELEKKPGNCLSYFFCQASEARLSNATAVLRGLIYRLVDQRPSLISHLWKRYDRAGKHLFEDGNAWEAISKVLTAMLNDPSLDGAILIVDALDECKTSRDQLLDFIVKPSRVKWIVSSRNWQDIEEKLDDAKQKPRVQLELNQDSISNAVDTYIGYKVRKLSALKNYDHETRNAVQRHLVDNADGTFLWVALVCQGLADGKVARKRHTLSKLKLFPSGLDALYKRMMEQISESNDAVIYKEMLAVTSVAYQPIALKELKVLVKSLNEDDYDDLPQIIAACGSFLSLRDGAIYFVHQSARDFLLTEASDQILPSGAAYQHHAIFSRSLVALSVTLKRDVCNLGAPGFPIDKVLPSVLEPLFPVQYSCIYWVDHLQNSDPSDVDNILRDHGDIHRFIQRKYLYWLESLSLLRKISEGVKAVHKLEALVRNVGAQQLTKLLQDARRFVLSHKSPIEIAPLQTYVSALVFRTEHSPH